MKRGTQTRIAKDIGVSDGFICLFFQGKKKFSWTKAKIAGAKTNTDPVWWVEGRVEEIKSALSEYSKPQTA